METFITIFQQILFLGVMGGAVYFITQRVKEIRNNILLGKSIDRTDKPTERRNNMILIAFGQKRMFDRPFVGLLHLIVYVGFLLVNVELLEILLDGILGTHRLFAPYLGGFYTFLINFFELTAWLVVIACSFFLIRRNIIKIPRFQSPEMKGWAEKDGNLILIFEITLMFFLFTMNAADTILQTRGAESVYVTEHYLQTGTFFGSLPFTFLYQGLGTTALILLERVAWWIHLFGILGFTIYVTYSKHLHIILAFPNTYFANLEPSGKLNNLESVQKEVQIMMSGEEPPMDENPEEIGTFGAKDIQDLTWKNLLDAYTCTECGRCTSVCPANLTGKKLSPRKIMMDTRDRMEQIGKQKTIDPNFDDEKNLYGDYITKEEILACTTCNACTEACPVNIEPVDIIMQLRRYMALDESDLPSSWNTMLANTENNFAPWAFSPTDRFNWAEELQTQN